MFFELICPILITIPSLLSPSEILYEEEHINQNRGPEIVASSITCIALAMIAVGLRLLARRASKAGVKYDDYMIIFALVRNDML